MATRHTQGAASAASNVVRLPTAAKRIVRQKYGRGDAFHEAKQACIQFPREFIFPGVRAAKKTAEAICSVQRTPELAIMLAVLGTMERVQRAKVMMLLGIMADRSPSDESAQTAADLVAATILTSGEL